MLYRLCVRLQVHASPAAPLGLVGWCGWQFKPEQWYYYYRSIDITDGTGVGNCGVIVANVTTVSSNNKIDT